jgi:hypothetical protein
MPTRWFVLLIVLLVPMARAQNAEIAATVVDERGKPVADAVVVAVPADASVRMPTRPREDLVDQVDRSFSQVSGTWSARP